MITIVALRFRAVLPLALAASLVAACGSSRSDPPPTPSPAGQQAQEPVHWIDRPPEYRPLLGEQGIFGPGGALGPAERPREEENLTFVNPHLWRAALDVVSFMPLAQADPFGGVIITDWYSPPETPDERFKLNVYILDTVLRADAIKVAVFRQTNGENGWRDATVEPQTATTIEDNILTRARELRITALNASG
jgi:hypothetical protein